MSKFYSQGMAVLATVDEREIVIFSAHTAKRANEVAAALNTLFIEAQNTNDEVKLCDALQFGIESTSEKSGDARHAQHLAAAMLPFVVLRLQQK